MKTVNIQNDLTTPGEDPALIKVSEPLKEISTEAKASGRHMTVFGLFTIILGVAAIAAPAITGLPIVISVGLLVIAAGILRVIWASGMKSFGTGLLTSALSGLTLVCGIALVTDPLFASGFMTVLIATYLYIDGVVEIIGAFRLRPAAGRMWLLVGGFISIILGTMVWRRFPLSGTWSIGILLGVNLLFSGIVMIAVGSAERAFAKGSRQKVK